jgi:hypothetical protein
MKKVRVSSIGKSGKWCKSRLPEPDEADVLGVITGVPRSDFLRIHAGREVVVSHGPVARFQNWLGSGAIGSRRALAAMALLTNQC